MIEARALTKRYGDKVAVDALTFTVRPGIVTGFLGPNGAGKSTTMRMILGLDRPTAGSVTVNGRRYVEQAAPLHEVGGAAGGQRGPHLPLGVQPPARPGRDAPHPGARVDEVIDLVGLRRGRPQAGRRVLPRHGPAARYRLRAARRPADVILDEPVNGLDPEGIRWVRDLLKGAGGGRADGLRLEPPDERDGADRRARDRRRPRSADRRHAVDDLHPQRVDRTSSCVRTPEAARAAVAAGRPRRHRLEQRARPVGGRRADRPQIGRPSPATPASCCTNSRRSGRRLEEAFMDMTRDSVEFHGGHGPRRRGGSMSTTTDDRRRHRRRRPGGARRSHAGVSRRRRAASEWIKLRSLRSSWLTLAAAVIGMIGIGAARRGRDQRHWSHMQPDERRDFDAVAAA